MCLWGAMFAAIAALPLSASEATSSPVVINAFMTRSEILSLLILVKHLSVALKGPGGSSGPGYKLDILRINPVNEIICGRAALPHPSELEIGPENQACEKVFSETYGDYRPLEFGRNFFYSRSREVSGRDEGLCRKICRDHRRRHGDGPRTGAPACCRRLQRRDVRRLPGGDGGNQTALRG